MLKILDFGTSFLVYDAAKAQGRLAVLLLRSAHRALSCCVKRAAADSRCCISDRNREVSDHLLSKMNTCRRNPLDPLDAIARSD
jgi:hypothetical protein